MLIKWPSHLLATICYPRIHHLCTYLYFFPQQKLTSKYESDTQSCSTLQSMINMEIRSNTCTVKNSATDALLWLKRSDYLKHKLHGFKKGSWTVPWIVKELNYLHIQGVSKKSRQFRNGSQSRAAASSMKFFVNIDCWDTCNVE